MEKVTLHATLNGHKGLSQQTMRIVGVTLSALFLLPSVNKAKAIKT